MQREEEDVPDQSAAFHSHEFVWGYSVLNKNITEHGVGKWTRTSSVELTISLCTDIYQYCKKGGDREEGCGDPTWWKERYSRLSPSSLSSHPWRVGP